MTAATTSATQARLQAAQRDPRLVQAALSLQRNDLASAERSLKVRLREDSDDIAALRMLAELAGRLGRMDDAQALLEQALRIAPDFQAARLNYATVLHRRNRLPEALAELDRLLAEAPGDPGAEALKAAVLARTGEYEAAIALYKGLLARYPDQARLWMSLGHALKTVGRQADSVAAYRRTLALQPQLGEAWWSLANLKTVRFEEGDLAVMSRALEGPVSPADRYHLHYALGKALDERAAYADAFAHYSQGAGLRRRELPYDPQDMARHLARTRHHVTDAGLAARAGQGCPDPSPIFVVGLPRAGSTLVEQILATHSQVEGTMELPDLGVIARDLAKGSGTAARDEEEEVPGYFDALLALDAKGLQNLGKRYLDRIRIQRKTDRPFFIDKMPNNFAHLALIHLILPEAKIVDARRHPMATCFSAFCQHFSRGQGFSYDLGELGAYYHNYVDIMSHFDFLRPGRVHRVFHERLVQDPETEIRSLLAYCGLDFEPGCLASHETSRPVRTASSEQVRRPISAARVEHWRNYEPWLEPLKTALHPLIDVYAKMSQA